MFDKQKFSIIIQNILNHYDNSTILAETANVNRTYISKILNMKLDNPPTPKVLRKIANNSKGLTTYEELMQVCGYLVRENNDKIKDAEKTLKFDNLIKKVDLSLDEKNILYKIIDIFNNHYNKSNSIEKSKELALSNLNTYSNSNFDLKKIKEGLTLYIVSEASARVINKIYENSTAIDTFYNYNSLIKKSNELYEDLINSDFFQSKNKKINHLNIPVVGTVAAGEPILADQNIIGYEKLPEQDFNDGVYFGLKIKRR